MTQPFVRNTSVFVQVAHYRSRHRRLVIGHFKLEALDHLIMLSGTTGYSDKKPSIVARSRLSRAPTMSSMAVTCESAKAPRDDQRN